MVQEICADEWRAEFPKAVSIQIRHGEWVINFKNHAADRHPSTIVLGENRKLQLCGREDFAREFFLPDRMTAQELGDFVQARCGGPARVLTTQLATEQQQPRTKSTGFVQGFANNWEKSFSQNLEVSASREKLIEAYRHRLGETLGYLRTFSNPYVIKAVEGLGKTSAHFNPVALEALDNAIAAHPRQRFSGFAFRSYDQARQKARECRERGHNAVIVQSFWQVYKEVCETKGLKPLSPHSFPDASAHGVLQRIQEEQPKVFDLLEQRRRSLWEEGAFNSGTTILLLTHALARSWHYSRITRNWYHPEFDPGDSHQDLRDQFPLAEVVFDELELDEFLHILPERTFELLEQEQQEHDNWRNLPRVRRYQIFEPLSDLFPRTSFESFDDLMRLDLSRLAVVEVDHDAIPFGNDNTPSGIYRRQDKQKYYVMAQRWLFEASTRWSFLTTENLMTEIVARIYERQFGNINPLIRLDLDELPGMFPIKVPIYIDNRATSRRVTDLAREIVNSDENATVISNGVDGDVGRVLTFQKSKGMNDLAQNDLYVILTSLAPEQYAQLNVIGRWLKIPGIIALFYEDQINQAVGRNRGFRQSSRRDTKTAIIASNRLYKNVLQGIDNGTSRTKMYEIHEKPWTEVSVLSAAQ